MHRRWSFPVAGLVLFAASLSTLAADSTSLISGVDKTNQDTTVRPQDDLFRFVNGSWLKKAEIPAERALYGSFVQLADKAEADLREIIEAAAQKADRAPGSEAQKVGELYLNFMDEAQADKLGKEPIEADLARINAAKDKAEFLRTMVGLQRSGVDGLFNARVDTDDKKSDQYILNLGQHGLGLPDEAYYRDPKFAKIREAYVAHVEKMLELAGLPDPKAKAKTVMDVETQLAKNHWDRVKNRDSSLTYNKFDRKALDQLTPGLDWSVVFDGIGAKGINEVIVQQPTYFTALAKLLDEIPLADWKTWLDWKVIRDSAPVLSKPFVEEDFQFYGKTLTGAKENRPRWKRSVAAVQASLGEVVGKIYVEKHFPPEAKARMQTLVKNLIAAYEDDIKTLEWMSPETRKRALDKLSKFTPKIAYPDKWRDYSPLEIRKDDLLGNLRRAASYEIDRNIAKLGKPVDRLEWHMTPQTVNAYYNPGMNEIVFPAAILQPPFFDLKADDAVNYGGIGAVIGHEIGHGFDDQGSKYDGNGNMNDWWTEADRKEFDARAKKLIEQYNGFSPAQIPDMHVNGALTIGENIGDLGGLTIGYKAYKKALNGQEAPVIDGLSGDQRFFMGWAQIWRSKYRTEELSRRLTVDPHSPTEFRCNGVVRNLPEFYKAFDVKEGDKLWLPAQDRVRIW